MKLETAETAPPQGNPRSVGRAWWKSSLVRIYGTTLLLYLISGAFEPSFLSLNHVMDLLIIAAFLGIMAMGQTLVVLTGGLDLSLAYTLNLGAVLMSQMATNQNGGLALVVTLAAGLAIGALNGIGIAYLGIAPIIMTMAMNSILQSITLAYTKGTPSGSAPQWLQALGAGKVGGINAGVVVWIALAVILIVLLRKTTFGRKVFSLGTNPAVSYLSGVNNRHVIVAVYMLSSLFGVLGGMLSVGYYGHAFFGMGDSLLLPSIAAVVIGGTAIMGGKGGYAGTAAGAIVIYILLSVLTVLHIANAGQQIIYGAVLLIVLFLNGRGKKTRS